MEHNGMIGLDAPVLLPNPIRGWEGRRGIQYLQIWSCVIVYWAKLNLVARYIEVLQVIVIGDQCDYHPRLNGEVHCRSIQTLRDCRRWPSSILYNR